VYARKSGISRQFSLSLLPTADTKLRIGTAYFADLVRQFGGAHFALATYNAGPNRVQRWIAEKAGFERDEFIDDIPFPETQNYVKKILGTADDYRRLYGSESPADMARDAAPAVAHQAAPAPAKKAGAAAARGGRARVHAALRRPDRRRRAGDRLLRHDRSDDGDDDGHRRSGRRGRRLRAVLRELRPRRDSLRRDAALRDAARTRLEL